MGITEMAERMKESFKQLGCKEAELVKMEQSIVDILYAYAHWPE